MSQYWFNELELGMPTMGRIIADVLKLIVKLTFAIVEMVAEVVFNLVEDVRRRGK